MSKSPKAASEDCVNSQNQNEWKFLKEDFRDMWTTWKWETVRLY